MPTSVSKKMFCTIRRSFTVGTPARSATIRSATDPTPVIASPAPGTTSPISGSRPTPNFVPGTLTASSMTPT